MARYLFDHNYNSNSGFVNQVGEIIGGREKEKETYTYIYIYIYRERERERERSTEIYRYAIQGDHLSNTTRPAPQVAGHRR